MMHHLLNLEKYSETVERTSLVRESGKIIEVKGPLMVGYLPGASIGSVCEVLPSSRLPAIKAEIVGFRERMVLLMGLGDMRGVGLGSTIVVEQPSATLKVGEALLGRVIDGLGQPLDDQGRIDASESRSLYRAIENPLRRRPIVEATSVGVRAINGLLSVGRGQRIGIMAGSGVGKSVLLGMMARFTDADVNVIALVGERGREVREFIEDVLGEEGLARSVVIVATSDQSPLMRMRAAFAATTVAEYFCEQGKNVLLMMDSVTRFAMAQREIGLAAGEPPASKGYTPSVFAALPKLLERAGSYENAGSITGLYTVLVEGDDMDDPIGDAVRSIVDGHIVLTRDLAQKGHFPAIDVLQSTSRVMRNVVSRDHLKMAKEIREALATYHDAEDLINIGAYKSGSNGKIDQAIALHSAIEQFLQQSWDQPADFAATSQQMKSILGYG